jgi:hypothetical protein
VFSDYRETGKLIILREVKSMAQDATAQWKSFRWIMWTFMFIVSVMSVVTVFSGWHTYNHGKQLCAVVFIAVLVELPVLLIFSLRRGKQIHAEQVIMLSYMMLMMCNLLLEH